MLMYLVASAGQKVNDRLFGQFDVEDKRLPVCRTRNKLHQSTKQSDNALCDGIGTLAGLYDGIRLHAP